MNAVPRAPPDCSGWSERRRRRVGRVLQQLRRLGVDVLPGPAGRVELAVAMIV